MEEVFLLAQEKQNQVRFCCMDYICKKKKTTLVKKHTPHAVYQKVLQNQYYLHFLSKKILPRKDLNFWGTVCDQV